eukprot:15361277-Ditylum_brightwellii.AAC.1
MNAFGTIVSKATWNHQSSSSSSKKSSPPAALLRGKIHHYNRMGGQWRIVVTDTKLRPRLVHLNENDSIEKKKKKHDTKRRKKISLWDQCEEVCNSTRKAVGGGGEMNDDDDFTIKLNGKLQILAYDDVV